MTGGLAAWRTDWGRGWGFRAASGWQVWVLVLGGFQICSSVNLTPFPHVRGGLTSFPIFRGDLWSVILWRPETP